MRTRLRSDGGQVSVEWLGVIVAVVVLTGVLLAGAPQIGTQITGGIERAICSIAGLGCDAAPQAPVPSGPVDPQLTPAERQALLGDPAGAQDVLNSLGAQEREWLDANDPQAAGAARAAQDWKDKLALVEQYQSSSLEDFLDYRDSAGRDGNLNWTSDGCSAPGVGGTGVSFDFQDACARHDYGYRNYKELGLFDERKGSVDDRFLQDMKDHCATRSIILKPRCYQWAYIFYGGVTAFG